MVWTALHRSAALSAARDWGVTLAAITKQPIKALIRHRSRAVPTTRGFDWTDVDREDDEQIAKAHRHSLVITAKVMP